MKTQAKQYSSYNPIETLRETTSDLGKGVKNSVQKDVIEDGWKDFFKQLLGSSETAKGKPAAKHGELKPGQELTLNSKKSEAAAKTPEKKKNPNILGGIDYRSEIVHGSERMNKREQAELSRKVEEINTELKKLIATSATLEVQFRQVVVAQQTSNVGKYHLNFMEWMLSWVKSMRKNAHDAGAYLKSLNAKKNQRKYGAMAKKHGTSFTMSNERGLATQNG